MSISMNKSRDDSVEMKNYEALMDSQASEDAYVQWYDSLNHPTDVAKKNKWALWVTCAHGDPSPRLVSHILAHSHANIVNERVMNSSLLFCLLRNHNATWGATRRCAQILIRAGADINAVQPDEGSLASSFFLEMCAQEINKQLHFY